jgi:hypothetical protein
MLMIPSIWFAYRLYELATPLGRLSQRGVRIAIVAAMILQPIFLVRSLPASWREQVIAQAVDLGVLKSNDALRMLYARQFLGLAGDGRRFYYSARPVLEWLERNARPDEKVLTSLTEIHGLRMKTVGSYWR